MFTGIIETMGKVVALKREKGNLHITIETPLAQELKVDQSVAHDGICLTVVNVDKKKNCYTITAVQETLDRTNLKSIDVDYEVNLERCLKIDGRLDGHIVQGHIDQTAICRTVEETDGSWKVLFEYDHKQGNFTIEKGSISVNGTSMTVVDSGTNFFTVAVIPYTFMHTNFKNFKDGTLVNVEFDVIGKYVQKLLSLRNEI